MTVTNTSACQGGMNRYGLHITYFYFCCQVIMDAIIYSLVPSLATLARPRMVYTSPISTCAAKLAWMHFVATASSYVIAKLRWMADSMGLFCGV